MKKNIFSAIFMATLVLLSTIGLSSCKKDNPWSTDQFTAEKSLLAFGPNPVAREGQLRFIGTGLDKVTSVAIPGCEAITAIKVTDAEHIEVTVPRNAEPGLVTLNFGSEKIVSKVQLTYTEPVGFDEAKPFSVDTIYPNDVLTINGEYLNLVQKVIFAKDVEVGKFIEHDRTHITLEVPATAQTGKVTISFCASFDTIPNLIQSKKELFIVCPVVDEVVELDNKKPGDEIKIAGKYFDLITTVLDPLGNEIKFEVNDEGTEITFVLPANITKGVIKVLPASGVAIPVATIGVALPKDINVAPATDLVAGSEVTITGMNLDMVSAVDFVNGAAATIKEGRTATEIVVVFPEKAQSGDVVLHTTAGIDVTKEQQTNLSVSTLKPSNLAFGAAAYAMGSDVTITGADLNLVVKVTFSGTADGVEVTVADPTTMTVKMPAANVETGKVVLEMANGETVETPSLTINAPEFCYITKWPELEEGELIQAGNLLQVSAENTDKLTEIQINGETMQYIIKGNDIFMDTPNTAKDGAVIKLISSNGEIEYTYDFKPNTEIETVIWKGAQEVGNWSGSLSALAYGGFDWSTVQEGMGLRIYYTLHPDGDYHQMRAGNGNWVGLPSWKQLPGSDNDGNVPVDGSTKYLEIILTAADLAELQNNGGLIVCGAWFIVSKVTLVEYVSLEETIWKGEEVVGNWSGSLSALAYGGFDWSTVKVGKILRIHYKINPDGDYHQMRAGNGNWVGLPSWKLLPGSDADGNVPISEDGSLEIKLTAEDLNELVNNGGLIVCGAWFIVTSVGLE